MEHVRTRSEADSTPSTPRLKERRSTTSRVCCGREWSVHSRGRTDWPPLCRARRLAGKRGVALTRRGPVQHGLQRRRLLRRLRAGPQHPTVCRRHSHTRGATSAHQHAPHRATVGHPRHRRSADCNRSAMAAGSVGRVLRRIVTALALLTILAMAVRPVPVQMWQRCDSCGADVAAVFPECLPMTAGRCPDIAASAQCPARQVRYGVSNTQDQREALPAEPYPQQHSQRRSRGTQATGRLRAGGSSRLRRRASGLHWRE